EYPGTDDRANAQRGQRPRPEGLLETVARLVGFRNQLVDGLAAEQLVFRGTGRWWLCQKVSSPGEAFGKGTWQSAGTRAKYQVLHARCPLPLRCAACQLLHFAFGRAAGILPRLQRVFRLAFFAGGALRLLAFFSGQCACVCHECCVFLLEMSMKPASGG